MVLAVVLLVLLQLENLQEQYASVLLATCDDAIRDDAEERRDMTAMLLNQHTLFVSDFLTLSLSIFRSRAFSSAFLHRVLYSSLDMMALLRAFLATEIYTGQHAGA